MKKSTKLRIINVLITAMCWIYGYTMGIAIKKAKLEERNG